MRHVQEKNGRKKSDLVSPNMWFRFQLAVLMMVFDNRGKISPNEFKIVARSFYDYLNSEVVKSVGQYPDGYNSDTFVLFKKIAGIDTPDSECEGYFQQFCQELKCLGKSIQFEPV